MGFVGIFFVLSLTISTVGGLRCYSCASTELTPSKCIDTIDCPMNMDRCFSLTTDVMGITAKGCQLSDVCNNGGKSLNCCTGDLCNNAKNIGSSFILLLLSTAALYFL